jgi:integrase
MLWAAMARGEVQVGKVVEYGDRNPRYKIDFGRRWAPRYLYSFRGARFESRAMADAILAHVHMEVSKGRALDDVLSELAPHQSATSGVDNLLVEWLDLFRKKVKAGDRQPRTLREYERWARSDPKNPEKPENHFAWWYGRSVWEVDEASLEEWSYWQAEKGISPKSRRNVLAGFRSFLVWVTRKRRDFTVPPFPWPTTPDHLPTVLTRELQAKVLETIPEPKRGIFIAMADLLIRPSEARVLRVRDWTADELRVERAAKDRKLGGIVRGPKKATGVKTLPGSVRLLDWLEAHVSVERRLKESDGPLFSNSDSDSGWWSETSLRRTWGNACTRAGVPGVGLYEGTKHSTATHLKGLGADDRLLAAIMGHRDPRSVEKYAKVQGRAIRNALALLERADREPSEAD